MSIRKQRYFFVDTSFLLKNPEFLQQFQFDYLPNTVVLCRCILNELDGLKNPKKTPGVNGGMPTEEDLRTARKARAVGRTIAVIFTRTAHFQNGSRIARWNQRISNCKIVDEELGRLASSFAKRHSKVYDVHLLLGDNIFKGQAADKYLYVHEDLQWSEILRKEYAEFLENERIIRLFYDHDKRIQAAHAHRLEFEKKIREYGPQSIFMPDLKWDDLTRAYFRSREAERKEILRFLRTKKSKQLLSHKPLPIAKPPEPVKKAIPALAPVSPPQPTRTDFRGAQSAHKKMQDDEAAQAREVERRRAEAEQERRKAEAEQLRRQIEYRRKQAEPAPVQPQTRQPNLTMLWISLAVVFLCVFCTLASCLSTSMSSVTDWFEQNLSMTYPTLQPGQQKYLSGAPTFILPGEAESEPTQELPVILGDGEQATATEDLIPETTELPPQEPQTKDGMVLLHIPAGSFLMGSNSGETYNKPQNTITLDAFWIDRTEVTNRMYAQCVAEGGCKPPASVSSRTRKEYYGNSRFDEYPVINVTWSQAQAYCEWAGRRLPTEAEWEKAARGTDGRIYPWGNNHGDAGNYLSVYGKDTTAVGSFPSGASPYGALDMTGNVWEWVNDWYGAYYYRDCPLSNPLGPDKGSNRSVRGGAFATNEWAFLTTYNRYNRWPQTQRDSIGFRCASSTVE